MKTLKAMFLASLIGLAYGIGYIKGYARATFTGYSELYRRRKKVKRGSRLKA